jgi:membrane protein implicated in regulation of membrane protease activity/DNA-binding CsgD family transcriptional regulator
MDALWVVWIVVALVTLVGELLTLGLFFASLSVAALITAGLSFVAPLPAQVLLFCALSLLMAVAVRPAVLRVLPRGGPGQGVPAIGPVGERALAVDRVTHLQGQIRVGAGEFWSARTTERGTVCVPGQEVEVVGMDGLTALVRPAEPAAVPAEPARVSGPVPYGLSAREVDVLRLVALGMSNGEIAERLFLSPRTVHHHVSHILDKMGASGRMEAVRLGVERGIIRMGGDPLPGPPPRAGEGD